MGRFLNVGIIQMPISKDTAQNYEYLEDALSRIMSGYHKPELVVGVECLQCYTPEPIPGPSSDYFARLAKQYEIYFIPGTVYEYSEELPKGMYYNSAPIYDPKGRLIDVYRKMCPWYPSEEFAAPGNHYVAFDLPEKQTKIGVQICYDMNFPEISRNETLMGAEVLIKLTMDPQELYQLNKHVHYTRALENQAYLVSTNCVGKFGAFQLYGHSQVISPEGNLLWEGEQEEAIATVTLDLDLVKRCREYGTCFMDHYLQHLKLFSPPMPFAEDVTAAPVFHNMTAPARNPEEYEKRMQKIGASQLGKKAAAQADIEKYQKNLKAFFEERR
ncbi:carbon-nitrogen hydrolase family protein [Anaerovorax odorimutans]|uniref:Carbon-nitrogen hydrolase family protein n=1 Tax=Anaerovorax odorimutans TaxID=109327 RepID=A0ABT1RQP5_9FIRM|nr:carbon-nitrogen hydrolase family protein [Anaerovorax odorimutans]MCQ4637486.1 carbon-nitrogen hydrolase family protein [Anaerovorax odorimutans]